MLAHVADEPAHQILGGQPGEGPAPLPTVQVSADALEPMRGVTFNVHQDGVKDFLHRRRRRR